MAIKPDQIPEKFLKLMSNEDRKRYATNPLSTVQPGCPRLAPEPERPAGNDSLDQSPFQRTAAGRFLVRVTAFRHRLLDEDNLIEKYHVDCCRYAGVLPGDAARQTKIEVAQVCIPKTQKEFVRVEVFAPAGQTGEAVS